MQELVGLDLRAGRGATMSCALFEETVGPEGPPLPSLSGTSPSFDQTLCAPEKDFTVVALLSK